MIVVFDTEKDSEAIGKLAELLLNKAKPKDTREWVCEAEMVKMIKGSDTATLSAPVIRRYRKELQCKKEGKSWIYSTASIRAYLSR